MWLRKGRIFNEPAQLPTIEDRADTIVIYYSVRIDNKSFIKFFEIEKENFNVVYKHEDFVLSPGLRGCFDDSGVMPSSIVKTSEGTLLFYTGWNVDKGCAPYGHGIGVAIKFGKKFNRYSIGPILDRTPKTPYLVNSPFVTNNPWEMWYCNGSGWINNFPTYFITHATSNNGFEWMLDESKIDAPWAACSRPCILNDRMWFSAKNNDTNYEIFCFQKIDGHWLYDKQAGLRTSELGWDSEMVCYPYVCKIRDKIYMFYNGNDYGKSGIGVAEWII